MKKLISVALMLCLVLLCGCSTVDQELAAIKKSGAAGVWYGRTFGQMTELTLNDDRSCSMTIENDPYHYKGTWTINDTEILLVLIGYHQTTGVQFHMGETRLSICDNNTLRSTDIEQTFTFTREIPPRIEIAPIRTDAVYEDFIGSWNVEMLAINDIIMEINGQPISPSEFNADMCVSIGTNSAAVYISAESDTVYLLPASFADGVLTLDVESIVMHARLHEDGMMSICGITPLHYSVFPKDTVLTLYLRAEKEDLG